MKKTTLSLLVLALVTVLSSCTVNSKTMREPVTYVELYKNDFTLSDQVSAEATTTKILNIDWQRLFNKNVGYRENPAAMPTIADLPIIGNVVTDYTANYALYNLMENNKGYDVIFYPQFSTTIQRPILFGFIYKVTTVNVTSRLAKFNK